MKRTKRFTIRRAALGLAVAAVLVPTAQAKPTSSQARQSQSSVEIPYLSHGVGVSHADFSSSQNRSSVEIPYLSHGVGVSHVDFSSSQNRSSVEIPYLSHGMTHVDFWNYDASGKKIADTSPGVGPDQLGQLWSGSDVGIAPDDMTLFRPSNAGSPVVAESSGSFDVSPAVGGFGLAFVLLAGGAALAIRHNRKTRLAPA